jgi:hypothetical protein
MAQAKRNENNMDEYERRTALILIERLVREGTPEPEIVRQVEQLVADERPETGSY